MPADSHAPPPDLDFPAARAAAALYRNGLARGIPEPKAWAEATDLFALAHPTWPMPLAEREAARTVGALIASGRIATFLPRRVVPSTALLRRLAVPAIPGEDPVTAGTAPIPAPDRIPDARRTTPSRRPSAPVSPFLAAAPCRAGHGATPC